MRPAFLRRTIAAEGSLMRWFACVAVVTALTVAAGVAGTPAGGPSPDVAGQLAYRPARVSGWWGGLYTVSGGQRVRLYFSDAYPRDASQAARWVGFLGRLPHGTELGRLTVYFAPLEQVELMCGPEAYACYSRDDESIVTIAGRLDAGPAPEDLLAHEYGHHLARNRSNPPWDAVDWGTKRWASYENVCARKRYGSAYPGAESNHYPLNPGEAFAETYRALVDRQLSRPFSWDLADPTFKPDATALALARQDAVVPWKPSTTAVSGALAARGRSRRIVLATPRDGTLTLRLTLPAHAQAGLTSTPATRRRAGTFVGTVCGERRVVVRLVTVSGRGRFSLHVTKP
jgi:hypothetical protein